MRRLRLRSRSFKFALTIAFVLSFKGHAMLGTKEFGASMLKRLGSGAAKVDSVAELALNVASGRIDDMLLQRLAGLGASGNSPSNAERDLHRFVRGEVWGQLLPLACEFKVHVARPSGIGAMEITHACFLPHEVFANAYKVGEDFFHMILSGGKANLDSYWADAKASRCDKASGWYENNPTVLSCPIDNLRVPIGHHGDATGAHGEEKVMVLTWWGAAVARRPTLDCRILFTAMQTSRMIPGTLDELLKVFAWSVQALSMGTFPASDHNDIKFGPGHHPKQYAMAGLRLAGGFVGAWAEMRGDWEFLKVALALKFFWGATHICHLCGAKKHNKDDAGDKVFTDFNQASPLRCTRVSNAEFLHEAGASPLFAMPGFHIWRVWVDVMHTMDLGILQFAIPSALWELASTKVRWDGHSRKVRLYQAYADYRAWVKLHRLGQAAPRFEESKMKKDTDYPHWTQKNAKAAITRSMLFWVAKVTAEVADKVTAVQDPHAWVRRSLFANLVVFELLCRKAGQKPKVEEADSMANAMEGALRCYNWLALEASTPPIERNWKIVPKFHLITHSAFDQAKDANPRWCHCYSDEDFVGKVKK